MNLVPIGTSSTYLPVMLAQFTINKCKLVAKANTMMRKNSGINSSIKNEFVRVAKNECLEMSIQTAC